MSSALRWRTTKVAERQLARTGPVLRQQTVTGQVVRCSFCGKDGGEDGGRRIATGAGVAICDRCWVLIGEVFEDMANGFRYRQPDQLPAEAIEGETA